MFFAIFLLSSAQDSRSSSTWTDLGQLFSSEAANITQIGLRRRQSLLLALNSNHFGDGQCSYDLASPHPTYPKISISVSLGLGNRLSSMCLHLTKVCAPKSQYTLRTSHIRVSCHIKRVQVVGMGCPPPVGLVAF